ncbi:translation initiation factor IF-2 domain protein, partial [Chlamydia psittaci 01DC11]
MLEAIFLLSEILDLKANLNRDPFGTIIESKLDKGLGVVATVIVEN